MLFRQPVLRVFTALLTLQRAAVHVSTQIKNTNKQITKKNKTIQRLLRKTKHRDKSINNNSQIVTIDGSKSIIDLKKLYQKL